jgi:GntR family transcriptional regulator
MKSEKIPKSSPGPLYMKILDYLCGEVEKGNLRAGDTLPSERALTEQLHVSRGTVRQALLEGVRRGLFETVNGRGTFVTPKAIYAGLAKVTPFPEAVRKMGGIPAMRFLSTSHVTADPITARALDLEPGDPVTVLRLMALSDGEPMSRIEAVIPIAWGKEAAKKAEGLAKAGKGFSLYQVYEELGLRPMVADQTLEVSQADEGLAKLLGVVPGSSIFLVSSVATDEAGKPVELRRTIYRGDRYRFFVRRAIDREAI